MPDLAHRIETFQAQPDPLAQQEAMLKLELLKAQIAKENAQAAHYASTAQLAGAKSETEVHKQANIQSDTDQKNLDFVEQESGVKQERAKELHGEQARSQMKLKLLEHDMAGSAHERETKTDLLKQYLDKKVA
jgi:hypothetical protein